MAHPLPTVRLAAPDDEDDILAMCRNLHHENGLFSLNENKVRDCIRRYFTKQGTIVGVIGQPGALQASSCLMLTDFYYTDDTHLAELWNFVEEPHRAGTRNAEALIEFGKDWARKLNLPLFTGIITNKQMNGKVRLYRKLLGYPVGAFFLYNGNWQTEPMGDHSELKGRLRQAAYDCSNRSLSRKELREVSTLLKEAANILASEGNIWAGPPQLKANGIDPQVAARN